MNRRYASSKLSFTTVKAKMSELFPLEKREREREREREMENKLVVGVFPIDLRH